MKHGGHEFDLHAIRAKVVEDEKWMVTELLLVHTMLLQRRDNIFGKRILGRSQEEMLLKVLEDMKTHHMPPLGGKEVNQALVFILNIYLEHSEIKHGAFGESGKPLKTQTLLLDGVSEKYYYHILFAGIRAYHVDGALSLAEDHKVGHP